MVTVNLSMIWRGESPPTHCHKDNEPLELWSKGSPDENFRGGTWKCPKCGRYFAWAVQSSLGKGEEMSTIIECHIHGIKYDFMNGVCYKCEEEHEAAKRVIRRLTCGLCGEIRASTQIMCGGAIGQLCQDCRDLIHKWEKAKKEHQERFEALRGSVTKVRKEDV